MSKAERVYFCHELHLHALHLPCAGKIHIQWFKEAWNHRSSVPCEHLRNPGHVCTSLSLYIKLPESLLLRRHLSKHSSTWLILCRSSEYSGYSGTQERDKLRLINPLVVWHFGNLPSFLLRILCQTRLHLAYLDLKSRDKVNLHCTKRYQNPPLYLVWIKLTHWVCCLACSHLHAKGR